jgi:uncharacterized protein
MSDIEFDWDDAKARSNLRDHGVDFLEAMTVLADPLALTDFNSGHSDEEDRFVSIGVAKSGRLLLVVHTFTEIAGVARAAAPEDKTENSTENAPYSFVRIISARGPTSHERRRYESGLAGLR